MEARSGYFCFFKAWLGLKRAFYIFIFSKPKIMIFDIHSHFSSVVKLGELVLMIISEERFGPAISQISGKYIYTSQFHTVFLNFLKTTFWTYHVLVKYPLINRSIHLTKNL